MALFYFTDKEQDNDLFRFTPAKSVGTDDDSRSKISAQRRRHNGASPFRVHGRDANQTALIAGDIIRTPDGWEFRTDGTAARVESLVNISNLKAARAQTMQTIANTQNEFNVSYRQKIAESMGLVSQKINEQYSMYIDELQQLQENTLSSEPKESL